ncbi:twitching motility protein PilT [Streptomyces sp. V4I2]|uniref:twitching motility protein PilT n=1 Tax=Streptomyces sp. V4I2 TaxID=3042280 RepID=UPI002787D602|nr:twitching motility protein PilT [Streptomyces sp. V4I2]MDQ1047320.1 rRNA-processing protein FCF1 [Streptomyces sp. V4I2]
MSHVVYDAGALLAAAKNNRNFLAQHDEFLAADVRPIVPAGVLAQCWDTRPKAANLHKVLRPCLVLPLTETTAKAAALLCQENGTADVVDATVVLASLTHDDALILTDDLEDIRALAMSANRKRIRVERP